MATYKGIQGYSVQKLSSDPTASEAAGQLWYNSSTGAYKISVGSAGAWASGADINTARSQEGAAGISNSSALIFGGAVPFLGGDVIGTIIGGSPPSTAGYTESWNGTSWTSKNVLSRGSASPAASAYAAGAGSTTSALFFGGDEGPNTTALCEQFDGTNWTEVGNLTTARSYMVGAGTSNASVITFGGYPGPLDVTEEWNGSSWTEVADLNTARQRDMAACQGTTTASLCFGGDASPDHLTVTEKWDGTSWTEVADLATGVNDSGGAGVQSSAISAGGVNAPSPVGVVGTEEWTDPVYTIKTVTVS